MALLLVSLLSNVSRRLLYQAKYLGKDKTQSCKSNKKTSEKFNNCINKQETKGSNNCVGEYKACEIEKENVSSYIHIYQPLRSGRI